MKGLLILIGCLVSIMAAAQQQLNRFYLVDASTGKAIPSVNVSILRAQLSITTEKDGIFQIPGNLSKMRDTIIFSAQSYEPLKLALKDLGTADRISLKKAQPMTKHVKVALKRDTLLNDFDRQEVSYYAGFQLKNPDYHFLQLAQRFEAPQAGSVLHRVYIQRLAFKVNPADFVDSGYYYSQLEFTRFRLKFYDIDPTTGGPGKDLCSQVIEINSTDQNQLSTELSNYNIEIPNKVFFVAIEWLRNYYNVAKVKIFDSKERKTKLYDYYKPSIGISPVTGKHLNIWALNFSHNWKPYTEFAPFGTDLAIKVNVNY